MIPLQNGWGWPCIAVVGVTEHVASARRGHEQPCRTVHAPPVRCVPAFRPPILLLLSHTPHPTPSTNQPARQPTYLPTSAPFAHHGGISVPTYSRDPLVGATGGGEGALLRSSRRQRCHVPSGRGWPPDRRHPHPGAFVCTALSRDHVGVHLPTSMHTVDRCRLTAASLSPRNYRVSASPHQRTVAHRRLRASKRPTPTRPSRPVRLGSRHWRS